MNNPKQVILVNKNDQEIGVMEKIEAHQKGVLHRAFSVFLFNQKGEMLLQQRADNKYHSPNLWSNSCCSHPMPKELVLAAANRRLKEELGINTELNQVFTYTYFAKLKNGLIEHEFDHILMGNYSGNCNINLAEVQAYNYVSLEDIEEDLVLCPKKYSEWFKLIFPKIVIYRNKQKAA